LCCLFDSCFCVQILSRFIRGFSRKNPQTPIRQWFPWIPDDNISAPSSVAIEAMADKLPTMEYSIKSESLPAEAFLSAEALA
jgi:hypothetical protein